MRRDLLDTHDWPGQDGAASRVRRSTSRHRSSYRKCARPAPMVTVASSGLRSVQFRGSRASAPASSWKNTRYSPQVCRHSINWKTRPRSGWNGCVIRKVWGALLVGGAIDSSRQRLRRALHRIHSTRMPRSRDRRERRRTAARREGLRRILHALADASQPRRGLAHSKADHAAGGRAHRRGPRGQRAAPSLRPRCRLTPRLTVLLPVTSLHSGKSATPCAALSMSTLAASGNGSRLAQLRQRSRRLTESPRPRRHFEFSVATTGMGSDTRNREDERRAPRPICFDYGKGTAPTACRSAQRSGASDSTRRRPTC